jgi:hypothetical protein
MLWSREPSAGQRLQDRAAAPLPSRLDRITDHLPGSRRSGQVVPLTLFLESPTLSTPLILDLTKGEAEFARLKKEPSAL